MGDLLRAAYCCHRETEGSDIIWEGCETNSASIGPGSTTVTPTVHYAEYTGRAYPADRTEITYIVKFKAQDPMRLGYMVPEFPGQTHIFFWREVLALRRLGEEVVLLSTRKPRPLNCRHAFASEAIAETRYLFPPNVSNLSGWIREGAPGFLSAQAYRRQIKASNLKNQIRHFGLLASAIDLAQWARQHRIDHIHGHSCADTAHV